MISFSNTDAFTKSLMTHVDKTAKDAERIRREATAVLVRELINNIPVWSGRTIRSLRVNNSGATAPLEPEPPMSQWARFGRTRTMAMGTEPMRAVSMAVALTHVAGANYAFELPVYVTINSHAWGLVENAKAPDGRGRNKAVVSEIAKAKVRSQFPQLR